jgi:hypothetical protein
MNQAQMFEAFQAFMNAQTTTPAAPKVETKVETKADAIMVIHEKTNKGVESCNVLLSKMPSVDDLKRSSNTFDALALAALGGHAWPEGLIKVTPKGNMAVDTKSGIAPNYRSMIKKIAAISPQKRREAWAAYVDSLKTLHGITFNGLYKAIMKANRKPGETVTPLKERIKECLTGTGKPADKIKAVLAMIEESEAKTIKAK